MKKGISKGTIRNSRLKETSPQGYLGTHHFITFDLEMCIRRTSILCFAVVVRKAHYPGVSCWTFLQKMHLLRSFYFSYFKKSDCSYFIDHHILGLKSSSHL